MTVEKPVQPASAVDEGLTAAEVHQILRQMMRMVAARVAEDLLRRGLGITSERSATPNDVLARKRRSSRP